MLVTGVAACARTDKASAAGSTTSSASVVATRPATEIRGASTEVAAGTPAGSEPEAPARPPTALAARPSSGCVVPSPAEPPPAALPAPTCPVDPGGAPELGTGVVTFGEAPAKPRVRVELADNDDSRTRGLMYRTHMDQDQGMLFSWESQSIRSFWMKNTCIPLDMLFIDQGGIIVGILEHVPTLNLASRGVRCPAAHVLEVNAGWTRQNGVFAGQKIEIER